MNLLFFCSGRKLHGAVPFGGWSIHGHGVHTSYIGRQDYFLSFSFASYLNKVNWNQFPGSPLSFNMLQLLHPPDFNALQRFILAKTITNVWVGVSYVMVLMTAWMEVMRTMHHVWRVASLAVSWQQNFSNLKFKRISIYSSSDEQTCTDLSFPYSIPILLFCGV